MRITRSLTRAATALTLGAGLLAVGPSPAGAAEAAAPAATESARCRTGAWPADAEGQPASFAPGAAAGVYLWHTDAGWHLRVTHPGEARVVFRGTVNSGSPITAVERRTESRDALVTPGRRHVGYRFVNFGKVDGFDFRVACGKGFSVNGTIGGRRLTPDQIFIGADGHHPAGVPFRVTRS